jgi:hypothetical protein
MRMMISLAIGRRSGSSISWCTREPSIAEMLSDSIVIAMMAADGVDPLALEVQLRRMAIATAAREAQGGRQTG